jgi:prevent-host-death family protein
MINVHEAKTRFSELLRRVEQGEEITLARDGQPVARLVAIEQTPRAPGLWRDQVWIAADFDDTPEELIDLFEG